jgi:hypothetical protein
MVLPNGRILYNSYGSQDVYVNTGNGAGAWTPMHVTAAAGYSRWLQYVHATGRVLIMTCPGFWLGIRPARQSSRSEVCDLQAGHRLRLRSWSSSSHRLA